ncbi:hypothetical protein RclHR1_11220002 [Rhizophagus clarus]|uniref:Uncharacterized protein n=1 Tax=Rhizophagus clarus TaxID=94130 RepID=A0A2Z6Q3K4_9GLOM|nr:hypothetical protein RclHR1_11220002 [Rhizophagus clarus]
MWDTPLSIPIKHQKKYQMVAAFDRGLVWQYELGGVHNTPLLHRDQQQLRFDHLNHINCAGVNMLIGYFDTYEALKEAHEMAFVYDRKEFRWCHYKAPRIIKKKSTNPSSSRSSSKKESKSIPQSSVQ